MTEYGSVEWEKERLARELIFVLKERRAQFQPAIDEIASWWLNFNDQWTGQTHILEPKYNLIERYRDRYTYCGLSWKQLANPLVGRVNPHTYRLTFISKPRSFPTAKCKICYKLDTCEIPL